jgi:hypothetical protein
MDCNPTSGPDNSRDFANELNTSMSPNLDALPAGERAIWWRATAAALAAVGGLFVGSGQPAHVSAAVPHVNNLSPGAFRPDIAPQLDQREVEQLIQKAFDRSLSGDERQLAERELASLDPGARRLLPMAWSAYTQLEQDAPAAQKEALLNFILTRQLGIEFPERLPPENLREIIQNRQNLTPDGRPLAIFVWSKGDHNRAFYSGQNEFSELIAAGYRVLYFEVESDAEFVEALRTGTGLGSEKEQRASLILVGGHGAHNLIMLERDGRHLPNSRGYIDLGDQQKFLDSGVADTLAKGGQIILDSCSNGEGRADRDNMANFFRRVFPHAQERGIWSATESYLVEHFYFDHMGVLVRVDFQVPEYRAIQEGKSGIEGDIRK